MRCLETTEDYTDDKPANGSMFRLKEQYRNAGWGCFPLYDNSEYAEITCPSCEGALLTGAGKIVRLIKEKKEKVQCPVCDGEYAPFGLKNHLKFKHPDYRVDM